MRKGRNSGGTGCENEELASIHSLTHTTYRAPIRFASRNCFLNG